MAYDPQEEQSSSAYNEQEPDAQVHVGFDGITVDTGSWMWDVGVILILAAVLYGGKKTIDYYFTRKYIKARKAAGKD